MFSSGCRLSPAAPFVFSAGQIDIFRQAILSQGVTGCHRQNQFTCDTLTRANTELAGVSQGVTGKNQHIAHARACTCVSSHQIISDEIFNKSKIPCDTCDKSEIIKDSPVTAACDTCDTL